MEIVDLPLERLNPASWNPNEADDNMLEHLAASIGRFGLVAPLVVRPLGSDFEVLSGNQRLRVLSEQGTTTAPCVVVEADDAQARLLAQAMNAVHGEDDLGRRALLVRKLLHAMPAAEVAAILPYPVPTIEDLARAAGSEGPTLADALVSYELARRARLVRRSFALAEADWDAVEEAVARALPAVAGTDEPNRRGLALRRICVAWLASQDAHPP